MSPTAKIQAAEWPGPLEAERCVDVQQEVKDLTSAIASGSTAAFTRFFDEWFDSMYAEAARATGRDESFCLDVVQDAMMRVVRSMKPMSTTDDLRRWLRVVVKSCAYDRLRGETRRRARELRSVGVSAPAVEPHPDLGARLEWLHRELQSLDKGGLDLLLMRHRFGWTLQQIGRRLKLTPGAVDGRLRRLVATLRRKSGEEFND